MTDATDKDYLSTLPDDRLESDEFNCREDITRLISMLDDEFRFECARTINTLLDIRWEMQQRGNTPFAGVTVS